MDSPHPPSADRLPHTRPVFGSKLPPNVFSTKYRRGFDMPIRLASSSHSGGKSISVYPSSPKSPPPPGGLALVVPGGHREGLALPCAGLDVLVRVIARRR